VNTFDLTGKVAIVTGSNAGLGAGMAVALATAGCDIVGVSRADAGAELDTIMGCDTNLGKWASRQDILGLVDP